MRKKRLAAALLVALALILSPSYARAAEDDPSQAVEQPQHAGWVRDDSGAWRYFKQGSSAPKTGWFKDPATKRWHYLVKSTGIAKTGWLKSAGSWYYFAADASAGPAYMRTGWVKSSGSWYYLAKNGTLHTGWLKWGSDYYYFNPSSGKMTTGWAGYPGHYYFFNANGKMRRGWLDWGSQRYYFGHDGVMSDYWTVVDGVYQAFEADGRWASARVGLPAGDAERMANLSAQQRALIAACDATPWPGANLCAGWVSQVFSNAGLGIVAGNACDVAYAWATSSNLADLKPGMIIAVPTHPRTDAGRIWGHVGIYVGNGLVRDSARTGLRTVDLGSWIGWYGATYPVKWGWANGIALA